MKLKNKLATMALGSMILSGCAAHDLASTVGNMHIEKQRFSLNFGCNNFFGELIRQSNTLEFSGVASTKMMCEPATQMLEDAFTKALNDKKPFSYSIKGNQIRLFKDDFSAILELNEANLEQK